MRERAYAPHCDPSILHSPKSCIYCDEYPDWQQYRILASIAFSDEQPVPDGKSPCPSSWFRSPLLRDLWSGNVPKENPDA